MYAILYQDNNTGQWHLFGVFYDVFTAENARQECLAMGYEIVNRFDNEAA